MARSRSDKNARIKLLIAKSLVDALYAELEHLGVSCKVLVVEDREVKNRSEYLRTVIDTYAQNALNGGSLCEDGVDEEEDRVYVDFYLQRSSRGFWESCIRAGVATDYNDLANQALLRHFQNEKQKVQSISLSRPRFRELLERANPQELRDFSL